MTGPSSRPASPVRPRSPGYATSRSNRRRPRPSSTGSAPDSTQPPGRRVTLGSARRTSSEAMRMGQLATIDRRAATWGAIAVAVILAITILGSGNLRWFDAALVGYLFGTMFAAFGIVYRYLVWLRRPPTAMLNKRGWESFRRPGATGRNLLSLPGLIVSNLLLQRFIKNRSMGRWLAHLLVFWGCILAALVTFPLVLGLLHFQSVGDNGRRYQAMVAGVGTMSFDSRSII